MQLKYGFISVDDHVQEPPDLWTQRLSKNRWGDRIPAYRARQRRTERWVVDGQMLLDGCAGRAGALMADRNQEPSRWDDVPPAAYVPTERLKAMDAAGIDYSVLYPTVAGLAGETFGRLEDPELELACVQAYNDWLIDEWAGASERFIPQCIVPIGPVDATVAEIKRAVARAIVASSSRRCPCTCARCPTSADPNTTRSGHLRGVGRAGLSSRRCVAGVAIRRSRAGAGAGRGPGRGDQAGIECLRYSLYSFSRVLLRHPRCAS